MERVSLFDDVIARRRIYVADGCTNVGSTMSGVVEGWLFGHVSIHAL